MKEKYIEIKSEKYFDFYAHHVLLHFNEFLPPTNTNTPSFQFHLPKYHFLLEIS